MTEDNDRILQKIQKLMALGESSNIHESANALAKAQTLMAKYGLDQKAIDMSRLGNIQRAGLTRSMDIPRWYSWFVYAIDRCFGVKTVMSRVPGEWGDNKRGWANSVASFTGPRDRIELAAYTFEVLGRQLLAARKAYNASLGKMDANQKWKLVESYCEGWVATINDKIETFAVDAKEVELRDEYMRDLFTNVGSVDYREKEYNKEESRALHRGCDDASEVDIHRPVNGTESIKIGVQK
ncbi:MAG: DUF2786 domain-containing protein [Aeromonas popoffii]|uniref:DUF2786 domain-containing protein n=1 Tax=Aeromonas popoffii TaxID=70856 RepID=UPI003F317723